MRRKGSHRGGPEELRRRPRGEAPRVPAPRHDDGARVEDGPVRDRRAPRGVVRDVDAVPLRVLDARDLETAQVLVPSVVPCENGTGAM